MWKTISDVEIPDINEWVRLASQGDQAVHIGTDSLNSGKYTTFVTVIAILNPGKGGRAAYLQERVPRMISTRERLMKEVWISTSIGLTLSPVVKGDLTVHIDASPVVTNLSNRYVQELVGMVVSQGFKAVIKPDSWVATHAADHVVRGGHGILLGS